MPGVLLEAQDLHLSFRGVKALVGVSFSVSEGDLFAVIGPNGAGKTSLLNVLSGLYRPQRGQVLFQGENLAGQSPQARVRKGLGRTFQNLELFRGMTVLDNVKLGAELAVGGYTDLVPRAQIEWKIRRHAEEVLDYLHLSPYRHAPAGALPYGLQKRVEVARAVASTRRPLSPGPFGRLRVTTVRLRGFGRGGPPCGLSERPLGPVSPVYSEPRG